MVLGYSLRCIIGSKFSSLSGNFAALMPKESALLFCCQKETPRYGRAEREHFTSFVPATRLVTMSKNPLPKYM